MMRFDLYDNKELNFVELNCTGTNHQYVKFAPESRYVDSVVFNLFSECFEKASSLYEYYGPTKYNARYIVPLRYQLLTHLTRVEKIANAEEFGDFFGSKVLGKEFLDVLAGLDNQWKDNWKTYHEKLVALNKQLLEFIDFCIDEDRILWVLGY